MHSALQTKIISILITLHCIVNQQFPENPLKVNHSINVYET